MAYFKINNIDFSMYVSSLEVGKTANYNAQTNAAGDTVVDYINSKRTVEVSIIPLKQEVASTLLAAIENFSVTISFLNPKTNALETIQCIIPDENVSYYTIQANNVMLNNFNLVFTEL